MGRANRRRHGQPRELDAAVDEAFMRSLVRDIAQIGSCDLGFRQPGTAADDEVCALIAERMDQIGLTDVALEPVPADGWTFRGATLSTNVGDFACSAFGGAPPTRAGGIEAELVFAGRGSRAELAKADVAGKIVLFDWPGDHLLWPSLTAAQATRAGAVATICACLPGGRYYQLPGAIGSFDGLWIEGSVPLANLAGDRAQELVEILARRSVMGRLNVNVELHPGVTAHNTVGTLPGRRDGPPIVVAGHHDCWFAAGLDDATGVASSLGIAKAMLDSGYVPEHPIVFGSHTGEEFGRADSAFDWLIGACWQINEEHPDWGSSSPFYLNIEGTGLPLPAQVDTPPELRRFCRRVCAQARRDGLLPYGVHYGPPRTGTEQWPFLAAGVPSLNVSTDAAEYLGHEYHTQFDTLHIVDYRELATQTCLHARLVMAADEDPRDMFDGPARTAQLRRAGSLAVAERAGMSVTRVHSALSRFDGVAADATTTHDARRAAFATVASTLEALDHRDKQSTLHLQSLVDVTALDAAGAALSEGRLGAASRALARVGRNRLARHVGREVFAVDESRHRPDHAGYGWAAHARLTESPNLWHELASLRREPGARPPGPWLAQSLGRAREGCAEELQRRLDLVAAAFEQAADQLRNG